MKNILNLLLLVAMISSLSACKDDDKENPKNFQEENPLKNYLASAGFTEVSNYVNSSVYEFGITFVPKVAGKISGLVVKLPGEQTDLRVTIWDADTQEVLRTETIASVVADTETSKDITPLALTKDHEYMITFNTNDWYDYTRSDEGDASYPITAGNISVTGYAYVEGSDQVFPTEFQTSYYAGDLSFIFKQTN